MALSMSCRWWLNSLFNKFWDKSLMIGYNLERFANSLANLEHVILYFNNLVDKKWNIVNDFAWDIFTPLWIHAHPKWTHNGKLKLKLVCPEKKTKGLWRADAQECQPCVMHMYSCKCAINILGVPHTHTHTHTPTHTHTHTPTPPPHTHTHTHPPPPPHTHTICITTLQNR